MMLTRPMRRTGFLALGLATLFWMAGCGDSSSQADSSTTRAPRKTTPSSTASSLPVVDVDCPSTTTWEATRVSLTERFANSDSGTWSVCQRSASSRTWVWVLEGNESSQIPGVVATLTCASADTSCINGDVSFPASAWTQQPLPAVGALQVIDPSGIAPSGAIGPLIQMNPFSQGSPKVYVFDPITIKFVQEGAAVSSSTAQASVAATG